MMGVMIPMDRTSISPKEEENKSQPTTTESSEYSLNHHVSGYDWVYHAVPKLLQVG